MKKIYFKGLTELRAVAALFVLFHHIELYKYRDGAASLYDTALFDLIKYLGKNGVYIFFVLSGFLITYLLLSEKQINGKIEIKKFYFRRILRIWPLYYLIVFISFLIIPLLAENFTAFQNETHYFNRIQLLLQSPYATLVMFLLFLPNFALAFRPAVVGAAQSWSVGVEEQFYLLWPHIINRVTKKYSLLLVFTIICFLPQIAELIAHIYKPVGEKFITLIGLIPIHFMAVGGIGAFVLFKNPTIIKKFFSNPYYFALNTLALLFLLVVRLHIPLRDLLFGSIVMIQILFIIQSGFRVNLRNRYLERIGDISYGVYMYHPLMMYFCFAFWNSLFPVENMLAYNIAIYTSITLSTLVISRISFRYFESRFLALKNKKFSIIKTGKSLSKKLH